MAGPIRISILANGRQARQEAARTATTFTGLGRSIARIGAAGGLAGLTFAAARFAKASVDLEAKYSTTMRTIQAATGASSNAMERLNDLALQLGQDTAFSANDAAEAMLELSKAGITTRNIMRGGVAGTLQLAAAGGTELGVAATIASNAMNAFNLAGRDMDRIAAALAGGANASTASVESLGQALSQVGPGAVNAGLSLNETVAALSAFDSAGVKGSDAGTSLKTMLARLVPQTVKAKEAMKDLGLDFVKSNGEFESLTDIAGQLNKRLGELAPAQRQVALNTIFGSDASRAATILMRQGEDGIRKFIKATNDQNAAQEMAAARMGGTAGSLERLSGAVETAQLRLGQELAPTVQRVADSLADNAVPAMEGTIDAAKTFANAIEPITDGLKELAEIGVDTVKFIDDLPGPIKEIGIQAGIAALVLPRLSASVATTTAAITTNIARLQQWRAEMTYTATRAQLVSTAMTRMAGAARTAAGVGGMVALTQSTSTSNEAMSGLLRTAGLAATGLAVGGPVGAAVGGLAGVGWQLYDALKSTDKQMAETATSTAIDYAAAIDAATGAVSRLGREQIVQKLQQDGILAQARLLGIHTRDLVGATLGNTGAIRRVNAAYAQQDTLITGLTANKIGDWIYEQGIALNSARRSVAETSAGYERWKKVLQGVPREVRVRLRNVDYKPTVGEWRNLNREIKLTPRQRQIIIKAIGYDPAIKGARNVNKALDDVGKKRGNLSNWQRGLIAGLTGAEQKTGEGVRGVNRKLDDGIRQGANAAAGTASSGGNQVGSNLQSGIMAGFAGTAAALAAEAASAVRQAVNAAKAAGDIRSPSRKMRNEVGKPLAQGLTLGFIDGVRDGSQGISRALDKLLSLIEKKYDGKKQADRRKALIRSLRDERAELVKNGKAQDRNNRLLDKAAQRYKALRDRADQFAQSIKGGFQTYGSIVGLGTTGGGSAITLPALLSQLAARATVAEEFAAVIESLRGQLNKTSLKQLLEQASSGDLEGALATAQAIATGGQGAIAQINELTAQITAAGERLGRRMRREYFAHGLEIAEGTVKGLEKRQRQLDRIADRLAQEFLKQAGLGGRGGTGDGGGKRVLASAPLSRTPALDAFVSTSAATATAPTFTVQVELTAQQLSEVEKGRKIQVSLDAYHGAGGRSKVRKS